MNRVGASFTRSPKDVTHFVLNDGRLQVSTRRDDENHLTHVPHSRSYKLNARSKSLCVNVFFLCLLTATSALYMSDSACVHDSRCRILAY